ncbi:hypothetical protein KKH03_01660, partial [Patescibacteria group bacterium]|nr:hypothetical protein [Patescibacteria group bacterium]
YAAEGGLEMGLLANSKQGAGYSEILAPKIYGNGVSTAAVEIKGQVPVSTQYATPSSYWGKYGAPTPGTGNVGADCDPLKAFRSKSFNYDSITNTYTEATNGAFDAADHPCNWNKIKVGESVSIPLYYTDSGGVHNLIANPLDKFIIRVRTPCRYGDEMCIKSGRYTFDFTSQGDSNYGYNDPLMSWQIVGEDANNSNSSLVLQPYIKIINKVLQPNSTIFHEKRLYSGYLSGDFEVLDVTSLSEDLNNCPVNSISNFLSNSNNACPNGYNWNQQSIQKPVLKLSVIKNLISDQADTIPYLEYQFLSNTSTPPTDTSQTITSEGLSGEFKWTLEVKKPQGGGLLEYVIQQ